MTKRPITVNGRTQMQKQWAVELGLTESGLSRRLSRGVDLEIALSMPKGGLHTVRDSLAKDIRNANPSVPAALVYARVQKGLALHDAATLPKYYNFRIFEFQGKRQALRKWAKELGIKYVTLRMRLHLGWSLERALTTPVRRKRPSRR